ncbi:hypothetical protein UT300019_25410 [Clostridium sp. CTA-19]
MKFGPILKVAHITKIIPKNLDAAQIGEILNNELKNLLFIIKLGFTNLVTNVPSAAKVIIKHTMYGIKSINLLSKALDSMATGIVNSPSWGTGVMKNNTPIKDGNKNNNKFPLE